MKTDSPSLVQISADYEENKDGTFSIIITISGLPHMSAVEEMSEWARDSLFGNLPKIEGFKRIVSDDESRVQ